MRRLSGLVFWAASQIVNAAPGLEAGSDFTVEEIAGHLEVSCDYDSGNAWAQFDCHNQLLTPDFTSRFALGRPTRGRQLKLTVTHPDGTSTEVEAVLDPQTGLSDRDFNLWAGSGRNDRPILRSGDNQVTFLVATNSGVVTDQGEFLVTVKAAEGDARQCRSGRMTSDRSSDCDRGSERLLCSQYFRYENYCRARRN